MSRPDSDRLARFFSKVTPRDGCWSFTTRNGKGYGVFDGLMAHRVAYEWFVGDIPDGLHIDHLCFNKACVNPAHLEPVTIAENARRGHVWTRFGVCLNGHEITPNNIYFWRKRGVMRRGCLTCRKASRRRWVNKRRYGSEATSQPYLRYGRFVA